MSGPLYGGLCNYSVSLYRLRRSCSVQCGWSSRRLMRLKTRTDHTHSHAHRLRLRGDAVSEAHSATATATLRPTSHIPSTCIVPNGRAKWAVVMNNSSRRRQHTPSGPTPANRGPRPASPRRLSPLLTLPSRLPEFSLSSQAIIN